MPSAPANCRRWYQFSLRTCLLALTVICIAIGYPLNRARLEDAAAREMTERHFFVSQSLVSANGGQPQISDAWAPEWLRRAGAGSLLDHIRRVSGARSELVRNDGQGHLDVDLAPLRQMRHVEILYLGYNPITDEGLTHLSHLRSLRTLDLSGTQITDEGLRCLLRLNRLEVLSLDDVNISDAGLRHLSSLQSLRMLSLRGAKITGPGLVHLAECSALEMIDLGGTQVESAGLAGLSNCKNLAKLNLSLTRIDDSAGDHLTKLTALKVVKLTGTKIGDDTMRSLTQLTRLRELDLTATQVTSDCIPFLEQLPLLESLYVQHSSIATADLSLVTQTLDANRAKTAKGAQGPFFKPLAREQKFKIDALNARRKSAAPPASRVLPAD